LPFLPRPHSGSGEPLRVAIRPSHDLTDLRSLGQDLLLSLVGSEGLALFDTERDKHREHDRVAPMDGHRIGRLRGALPVCESPRLCSTAFLAAWSHVSSWRGIGSLAVRIHLELRYERPGLLHISIKSSLSRPDVIRRRSEDEVAIGLHVRVAGTEDQEL